MFNRIDILLNGPICNCSEQDLIWGICPDPKGHGLEIRCRRCGTRLIVPYDKFVARWVLKVPYSGGVKQVPKEDNSPSRSKDGKVIHLFPRGKDNPKE